ncbi:MAG: ATP-binding protein [Bacteroidota bacterium]
MPLVQKRILVCGKGGSGKSTVISLLARALIEKGYKTILVDADASNPGGLFRLNAAGKHAPKPLIDFFGGRKSVTCPSDDPSPLTRVNDHTPVPYAAIALSEIPPRYSVRTDNLTLFQIGKIRNALEGCDGPMSKIARDFFVKGDYVTLIDMEAGIEHFGRGVEQHIDIIFIVVDPTYESMLIAELVSRISAVMGIRNVFAVINKALSKKMISSMKKVLKEKGVYCIGSVEFNDAIMKAGFKGKLPIRSTAANQLSGIVTATEKSVLNSGVRIA